MGAVLVLAGRLVDIAANVADRYLESLCDFRCYFRFQIRLAQLSRPTNHVQSVGVAHFFLLLF